MSDKYNSRIAKLVGWINRAKSGWAVTISKNTTLYSCSEDEVIANIRWLLHENRHKQQIASEGLLFYFKYFYYTIRYGYENNPYEVDAKNAGDVV